MMTAASERDTIEAMVEAARKARPAATWLLDVGQVAEMLGIGQAQARFLAANDHRFPTPLRGWSRGQAIYWLPEILDFIEAVPRASWLRWPMRRWGP